MNNMMEYNTLTDDFIPMINDWNYLYSLSYINNIHQNNMIDIFDLPDKDNKNNKGISSSDTSRNCESTIEELDES